MMRQANKPPWRCPNLLPHHRRLALVAVCALLALPVALAEPASKWRTRSIYQLLTDRFAGTTQPCSQSVLANYYCGGTWQGVIDKIDYVMGLNVDAVWPSPVTDNAYGGYHGYWPADWYDTNRYFGTPDDLRRYLSTMTNNGMWNMVDIVINHIGYSSVGNQGAPYNPFPAWNTSLFHSCDGCMQLPGGFCSIPDNATSEQNWDCPLAGLPDLNQSNPFVAEQLSSWIQWMLDQYPGIHGLRLDAMGHVRPEVWAPFMQAAGMFGLGEIWKDGDAFPKYISMYNAARPKGGGEGDFSFLNFGIANAVRNCFALEVLPDGVGPQTPNCTHISTVRRQLLDIGLDLTETGYFADNHDLPRFLATRPNTSALAAALAVVVLGEGIPIIYYGTEQGLKGVDERVSYLNREALWEAGYDQGAPLYIWIRMLNYYRHWMELWHEPLVEAYVDESTYCFQHGRHLVAVLANGLGTSPTYTLTGLTPGGRWYNIANHSEAIRADGSGTAVVAAASGGQLARIFVAKENKYLDEYPQYWVPISARPNRWQPALIATCVTLAASTILGVLLIHMLPVVLRAGKGKRAAALRRLMAMSTAELSSRVRVPSAAAAMSRVSNFGWPGSKGTKEPSDLESAGSGEPALTPAVSALPRSMALTHEYLALASVRHSHPGLAELGEVLLNRPQTVMHVALEYAVPHLGLRSELMFGGLGKVVEMFIMHSSRAILVCAPMYQPFFGAEGKLSEEHFGEGPISAFVAKVGDEQHVVDIYFTADLRAYDRGSFTTCNSMDAASIHGADASAAEAARAEHRPLSRVFYLLIDAEVFRGRTRGTIYSHADEDAELRFFSVFNQAVAHVAELLKVKCVQGHDYHGLLSLQHMAPHERPAVLYVAHNADYNGCWRLGSPVREAHVYSMLNIPLNSHTRSVCEHEGRFNMLATVLHHLKERQSGMGVVGVSAAYARRAYAKFSMFWVCPETEVTGILNGMDEDERGTPVPADFDVFLGQKAAAKLAFQARVGLDVGADKQLMVFLGRVTHQKGCDLIAGAADGILSRCPTAQIAMVGPIGDEWGQKAKRMLEGVARRWPGRVWNAAGEYIRGAEKDELILASDFFFCPSRFEPCGLADIEFGWAGAVMVGHETGGLGKMPGFYFKAELDNIEDLTVKLERTALKALAAPPKQLRALAEQALHCEFPPSECVKLYDQAWRHLLSGWHASETAIERVRMSVEEASFWQEAWLEDNMPYDPKAAETKSGIAALETKRRRFRRAVITNLLLIVLQGLLHAPSVLALAWYNVSSSSGEIYRDSLAASNSDPWYAAIGPLSQYFYIYAGSAIVWQAVGFLLRPRRFILLAAYGNVLSLLLTLWCLYIPSAMQALYLATACFSAIWIPVTPLIFLDIEGKVSVSQNGPALMGFSSIWQNLSLACVFLVPSLIQSSVDNTGFLCATLVLLVLAVLYVVWLTGRSSLPPVFTHFRLRLRGQLVMLLARRRTWAVTTALTTMDSFALTFLLSCVYDDLGQHTLSIYLSVMFCTTLLMLPVAGWFLSTRAGHLAGLHLMYSLALLPGVALIQLVLVTWAGKAGAMVAASVFQLGAIRYAIVGILALHTLPTRESLALVQMLQVALGSLALAAGGIAGSTPLVGADYVYVIIGYEVARLALSALLVRCHRRENMATP